MAAIWHSEVTDTVTHRWKMSKDEGSGGFPQLVAKRQTEYMKDTTLKGQTEVTY